MYYIGRDRKLRYAYGVGIKSISSISIIEAKLEVSEYFINQS